MKRLLLYIGLLIWCLVLADVCQAAPKKPDTRTEAEVRQQLVAVMDSQVGVRELTGRNDGVQVQLYLKAVGLVGNWPWCAAFVVWCIRQVGLVPNANGAARSFFSPKTKIWPGVPGAAPPQPGDPMGFRFVRKDIDHVGFVRIWGTTPMALSVQGNTSGNKADRDGQGVYKKYVLKSQIAEVADLYKVVKR